MGTKTKREIEVNGNEYYVVGEECKNYRRVSVYDNELYNYYPDSNDIIYTKKRKAMVFGLGKSLYSPPSLDEMMKNALNEAVCIFEDKQEESEEWAERVDEKLDVVKESHEE